MSVKVKICGIRSIEAARVAVKEGADFLGFNFVPTSARFIDPGNALEIISAVRGRVKIVGVFQDANISLVNQIASNLELDFVQLHGHEDNEYISQIKVPVIKSITVDDRPEELQVDYFLLDRSDRGEGELVNTDKARLIALQYQIFLAGGLTSENVSEAIQKVSPFGVDVAGGVETDGVQDINKIKEFIKNAKGQS